MKLKINIRVLIFIFLSCFAGALSQTVNANDRLTIYTVNYPLQYFAQRITGEKAQVIFPAPKDVDPAFWVPDSKTINAFQTADMILLNGANYAKWVNKASLPRLRIVNTSKAFKQHWIQTTTGVAHSHGTGADHSHTGIAFTTWLDMQQSVLQAEAIKNALIKKQPQFKAEFTENYTSLKNDLLTLDLELKKMSTKINNQRLIVSHPIYQYLARRYELNIRSVLWEPDEFPDEDKWLELSKLLKTHPSKWMIWEGTPKTESVSRLNKLGIQSLVFKPCFNVPAQGDFLTVMYNNINNLNGAF